MKIALLGNSASRHVHRWCQWLGVFGHTVTVFSDEAPRADMDYRRVRIIRPQWTLWQKVLVFKLRGGPYANNWHKWRAYSEALLAAQPDVLHAMEATAYGPMLARFPQFPRVLTPWGSDVECLDGGDEERRRLSMAALRAADVVATNAAGLEERWAQLSGQPRDKFRLFPWGIDRKVFRPAPKEEQAAVCERVGIAPGAPFVLSPRLAHPNYGIDMLLLAWEKVAGEEAFAKHHLVVLRAGATAANWEQWKKMAAAMQPPRVVMAEEYLQEREMAALYSAADAVVMIPERDLLAMSLVEAVACGALPILADLPAYRAAIGEATGESALPSPDAGEPSLRARAIYLRHRTPEGLAEAMRRWMAIPAGEARLVRDENARAAEAYFGWENGARAMDQAYALAVQRFRERQRTTKR